MEDRAHVGLLKCYSPKGLNDLILSTWSVTPAQIKATKPARRLLLYVLSLDMDVIFVIDCEIKVIKKSFQFKKYTSKYLKGANIIPV